MRFIKTTVTQALFKRLANKESAPIALKAVRMHNDGKSIEQISTYLVSEMPNVSSDPDRSEILKTLG